MKTDIILSFGMYKGRFLSEVIREDLEYVGWLAEKNLVHLDEKIKERALHALKMQRLDSETYMESEHGDWGDRD